MKRSTQALFGVAVLSALLAATPAGAIPITDTVNPTDTTITFGSTPSPCPAGFTCAASALSFVHDITDNGFALVDTITSVTVAIHLDDHSGGGSENYTFSIGVAAQTFSSNGVPSGGGETETVIFNLPSLADLQLDGKIGIEVRSTNGSFLFADSTLTAQVTKFGEVGPSQNEIPEPSILLLLGAGVAAFGWRSRRRQGHAA